MTLNLVERGRRGEARADQGIRMIKKRLKRPVTKRLGYIRKGSFENGSPTPGLEGEVCQQYAVTGRDSGLLREPDSQVCFGLLNMPLSCLS